MAWLPEDLTSARKEMFLASWDESHPLPGSSPDAQVPEPRRTQPAERRNSARGRGLGAASGRGGTAPVPQGRLRAYAARTAGGGAGGGGAGPAPAGTMAKTVAYFYDPDVGNFHYGKERGM